MRITTRSKTPLNLIGKGSSILKKENIKETSRSNSNYAYNLSRESKVRRLEISQISWSQRTRAETINWSKQRLLEISKKILFSSKILSVEKIRRERICKISKKSATYPIKISWKNKVQILRKLLKNSHFTNVLRPVELEGVISRVMIWRS